MSDETDGVELPPGVATAWGVRERAGKGPKRGLTVPRIVDAAIGIAANEGLGAVSMNRVASELGTAAMSLYRYVSGKDELIALMVDSASGTPPEPPDEERGWRPALAHWATALLSVYQKHPWLTHVPVSGPPILPNGLAWFERGLRCLAGTGLAEDEKVGVALLISGIVRSHATLEAQLQEAMQASASGEPVPGYGQLVLRLADPDRFPALHVAAAAGVFDQDDGTIDFEFTIDRVLDGIAVLIAQRQGSGGH